MQKITDLKNIVMDAMMEFYQEYIKPDSRKMMEEVLEEKLEEKLESKLEEKLDQKFEEKFDEHLGPIKASIMTLEKSVSVALGDYQGQQMQVSDHEKRITALESKRIHTA